jgi:hypothetical protein
MFVFFWKVLRVSLLMEETFILIICGLEGIIMNRGVPQVNKTKQKIISNRKRDNENNSFNIMRCDYNVRKWCLITQRRYSQWTKILSSQQVPSFNRHTLTLFSSFIWYRFLSVNGPFQFGFEICYVCVWYVFRLHHLIATHAHILLNNELPSPQPVWIWDYRLHNWTVSNITFQNIRSMWCNVLFSFHNTIWSLPFLKRERKREKERERNIILWYSKSISLL